MESEQNIFFISLILNNPFLFSLLLYNVNLSSAILPDINSNLKEITHMLTKENFTNLIECFTALEFLDGTILKHSAVASGKRNSKMYSLYMMFYYLNLVFEVRKIV